MKKLFILCAAFSVALLHSCSINPIDADSDQILPDEGRQLTANIMVDGDNSKVSTGYGNGDSWEFSWEDGDVIYALCSNSDIVEFVQDETDLSKFTGTIPSGVTQIRFFYGEKPTAGDESNQFVLPTMAVQDGDLDKLCMISDLITVSDGQSTVNPTLKHLCSFIEFNFNFSNLIESWGDISLEKIKVIPSNFNVAGGTFDFTKAVDDSDFFTTTTDSSIIINHNKAVSAETALSVRISTLPCSYGEMVEQGFGIQFALYFSNGTRIGVSKDFTGELSTTVEAERAKFRYMTLECDFTNLLANSKVAYVFSEANGSEKLCTKSSVGTSPYYIANQRDLRALATLTNDGISTTNAQFCLSDDITLSGNWIPIGHDNSNKFSGVFDGKNYSIKNLECTDGSGLGGYDAIGLFGYVNGNDATVKNLLIENAQVTNGNGGKHTAILTGTLGGGASILNCGIDNTSSVTLNERAAVAALVAVVESAGCSITNCYNWATVTNNYSGSSDVKIGGICASTGSTLSITNCYNSGSIVTIGSASSVDKGAILGYGYSDVTYDHVFYLTGCAGEGVDATGGTTAQESTEQVMALSENEMNGAEDITFGGVTNNLSSILTQLNGTDNRYSAWTPYKTNYYPTLSIFQPAN